MWRQRIPIGLCRRPRVLPLATIQRTFASSAGPSTHDPRQQQYALFLKLVRSLQDISNGPQKASAESSAIALDAGPLAANALLMEQLGVMDFSLRSAPSPVGRVALCASVITDACRAGTESRLAPIAVLQRIRTALRPGDMIPHASAAVLMRSAAQRVNEKIAQMQRCANGHIVQFSAAQTRADQGTEVKLRAALHEEVRRSYELLAQLSAQPCNGTYPEEGPRQRMDEICASIRLAAALQDRDMATRAAHSLLAENEQTDFSFLAEDMARAVSAFTHSRDFAVACSLYELYAAKLSSDEDGNRARLTLLAALADCVGTNVAHFSYVRESVTGLFTLTEVAYASAARVPARRAVCAVIHALARVALKPEDKMLLVLSFLRTVQRSSHMDVCTGYEITEALLRVASAARDGSVALVLYNQLASPHMGRGNVPSNLEAILIAEANPAADMARLISFMGMGRLILAPSAVQLLAAKLLLAGRPSEEIYIALDNITKRPGSDGQRTFMLRLIAFSRDLTAAKNIVPNPTHACQILMEWRDELHQSGVRTASLTALALLQRIHCHLSKVPKTESESSPLLELIDSMLVELSQGWLRHRAVPNRTPRFYKTVDDLNHLLSHSTPSAHPVTLRSGLFTDSLLSKESASDELVQTVFESLQTASTISDGVEVFAVLGLIDYACLCLAEDAHRSITPSRFSLDSMNVRSPLVYVTDALGELILRESPNVQRIIDVPISPWNSLTHGAVKDWLSLWLRETDTVFAPCGYFELQMEGLIREEQYSAPSSTQPVESDKRTVLKSAFVTIDSDTVHD